VAFFTAVPPLSSPGCASVPEEDEEDEEDEGDELEELDDCDSVSRDFELDEDSVSPEWEDEPEFDDEPEPEAEPEFDDEPEELLVSSLPFENRVVAVFASAAVAPGSIASASNPARREERVSLMVTACADCFGRLS
jgi:hypothetical protein